MSHRKRGKPRDAVETLDEILAHVVDEEMDHKAGSPSHAEDKWAQQLVGEVRAQLAAQRREATPALPAAWRSVRIPDEVYALTRDALISQLEQLRTAGAQFAHLDLVGLTTHDLRCTLAVALATERSRS